jgi:tRNA threonylcarbamoyladenosine biosynthesis protein TsaE
MNDPVPFHKSCTIALPDDPNATERLGECIGQLLRAGDTVALAGPLGAGKTTLVRGLARGMEIDDPEAISSPTYLLVIEHDGEIPLLHADAYLPEKLAGFLEDGGLEYLFDPSKVVVVEWAENILNTLPDNTLWVSLGFASQPGRKVTVGTGAKEHYPWLLDLKKMSSGD